MSDSLNQKLFQLEELLKKHSIISFDIFDTLLLRPFAKPTDLFFYMEDTLNRPGFAQHRVSAENKLRKELPIGIEEIELKDIYREMPAYSDLMEKELETELSLLYPNVTMKAIFEEAVKLGKKIIIVSDMYLPEEFIAKLLAKNGYNEYAKLYVSSTWKKEKWSGNLFRCVLDDLKVAPREILHIGDNRTSDIDAAKAMGINAYHITKVIDMYFNERPYRKNYKDSNWQISAQTMQIADRSRKGFNSYWEKFGYEFGGPVCYSYAKWLSDTVEKKYPETSDVIFVARDGYLLKKVFDVLPRSQEIKSHYIYAPRATNLACRMEYDLDYYDSLSQMKTIINFYRDDLQAVWATAEDAMTTKKGAHEFICKNKDLLKKCAEREYNHYKQYLSEQQFGAGTMILVDTITDKFSAQKLISGAVPNKVVGMYWTVLKNALKQPMAFESFQKENEHVLLSWNIMEFVMSAPEPSVHSVQNGRPVYNPLNQFEDERQRIFNQIAQGVQLFITDMEENSLKHYSLGNVSATQWINDFLRNPAHEDLEHFQNVKFSLLPDHSDVKPLNPFWASRQNSKFFIRNFKDRLWLYSQGHPVLYKVLHAVNVFLKQVKAALMPIVNVLLPKGTGRRKYVKQLYFKLRGWDTEPLK